MSMVSGEEKYLYILVRIPKCGSQTLREMVGQGAAGSSLFRLPQLDIEPDVNRGVVKRLRQQRRMLKGVSAYGTLTEQGMWKKISEQAKSGDIVSGHIAFGRAALPGWKLRYITLMRDPVARVVSEYFYTREGYLKRPAWRKFYLKGKSETAAKGSFTDYLEYLCEHQNLYANTATAFVTGSRTHPDPFAFLQENYFHYGVLEDLEAFAQQLSEKMNAKVSDEIWVNKTKTKKNYSLTDRDHELLTILIGRDIELYEKVVESISQQN